MMNRGKIILVEPSLHLEGGHYRDKYRIWVDELRALGKEIILVTLEKQVGERLDPEAEVVQVQPCFRKMKVFLPKALCNYVLFTLCYTKSFRLARKIKAPVMGLSSRAALPLWLASFLGGVPQNGWGLHQMSFYEDRVMGGLQKRAFRGIAAKGCHVFCNLPQNAKKLKMMLGADLSGQVSFLPDLIYFREECGVAGQSGKVDGMTLLVSGRDDFRRNAVAALGKVCLPRSIERVILHNAQVDDRELGTLRENHPDVRFEVCNQYFNQDGFYDLFAGADATLVSYCPKFQSGSGNLVASLVAGTPVVSSQFPHSEHVRDAFGLIGEFFEFGDVAFLEFALVRLGAWDFKQRKQFREAVKKIRREVSTENVVRTAMRKLCEKFPVCTAFGCG